MNDGLVRRAESESDRINMVKNESTSREIILVLCKSYSKHSMHVRVSMYIVYTYRRKYYEPTP